MRFSVPRLVCKVRKASWHPYILPWISESSDIRDTQTFFFLPLPNCWHCKYFLSFRHTTAIQHPTSLLSDFFAVVLLCLQKWAAKSYCGNLVCSQWCGDGCCQKIFQVWSDLCIISCRIHVLSEFPQVKAVQTASLRTVDDWTVLWIGVRLML